MNEVRTHLVAVMIALLLGGCGSDFVRKVERLADRACDCEDRECAEKVNAEFSALLDRSGNATIAASEEERLGKAVDRLTRCVEDKAGPSVIKGAPGARPAAEEPPPTEQPGDVPSGQ